MPVRPYHHGDLRSALLASAERTLLEKGVAALSLRELARDVGVSHAAPGRHFKDKRALLDALALVGFERMAEDLDAADSPELPLEARLTELATAYVHFAVSNAELLEVMYSRKHDPDISEQLRAAVEGTMTQFVQIVIDAQERGEIIPDEPWTIALVLGAALHGTASFAAQGTLTPEAAVTGIAPLIHHLLNGLRPRGNER
ncbi:TetR/AcrR family transcriptional regulator [Streptomyces sp. MBT65]|nr:TetR/AcrR family transcriptional regulator [Streptomyces sp. MBT65]MBK3581687.1 TetR/AcrR family transcriptional regulator [Streptomyces sp. MBT65]